MKPPRQPPTADQILRARKRFEEEEPRARFYVVAIELIALVRNRSSKLSLGDALAVLLQTWNQANYRFKKYDRTHWEQLGALLERFRDDIARYAKRDIASLEPQDEPVISAVFTSFERLLGPVGAAKSLHLLAPDFFPLWDREIALALIGYLRTSGMNQELYLEFMRRARDERAKLVGEPGLEHALKALDEFNYVTITLPILKRKRELRKMKTEE